MLVTQASPYSIPSWIGSGAAAHTQIFESLFCPVPEQRLLLHQAQSHLYLKLAMDTMRGDQARMGVNIISKEEPDEDVWFPPGYDSGEAWNVGMFDVTDSSAVGDQNLHSGPRATRHWWQIARQRSACSAAEDAPCDMGQPGQTGHASQRKAHKKQGLCWPRNISLQPRCSNLTRCHRRPQGPSWVSWLPSRAILLHV